MTWNVLIETLIAMRELWFYIGGMLLLVTLYHLTIMYYRRSRLKRSGIQEIDQMKGTTFEDYLKILYESQGYKVSLTPKTGDYGADLVLKKDNNKIVVQAKRYAKNVGIKAVQEVIGAKDYYRATDAWVVSNRFYTQPAINLAKANGVKLVTREQLMNQMIIFNNGKQTHASIVKETNQKG
ncbi:restriction endonuclease [Halolactibacillus alkaliphilus]|uniref:Restriction endonuclease n=1 Tax=Halolactibacillus alkaliphilus TaxID=442899 RepID=A0A511X559_9BACI|nr:restriction endonuclease [Halolactibacillus alkaliphilus]GEN58089.1 restriction endonuclease [Halolactibacillus alkaliphilus]GGN76228.1 restriction endonuclease [Halolactibacillus alkaliphilus]SFP13622.1 restriction system protein [Halolactibacillus alkaliphilus]